jgi:hypothetical protein
MSVNFSGIAPNNYPYNNRIVLDNNYITPNIAGPTTTGLVNTNAINLLNPTPYPTTEVINVTAIVGTQATANTANSKNINVALQMTTANSDGTANSSNWVAIPTLSTATTIVTDNAGGGWAAQGNVTYKLPPNCNQFIRAQFTGEANGGNASSANCLLELVF